MDVPVAVDRRGIREILTRKIINIIIFTIKQEKLMRKEEIIKILSSYKNENAEKYGIEGIGVFGSVVRDEVREDSDVDVVIRISEPDLFKLVGIKNELEERFNQSVDIITYRENMNPFLKKRIDGEAVYV